MKKTSQNADNRSALPFDNRNGDVLMDCIKQLYSIPDADDALNYLLMRTGDFMSASRVAVFGMSTDGCKAIYEWRSESGGSGFDVIPQRYADSWSGRLQGDECIICGDTSADEYSFFAAENVKSFVILGLSVFGKLSALLYIEQTRCGHEEIQKTGRTLAYFVASTLCRMEAARRQAATQLNYEEMYRKYRRKSEDQEKFYNTVLSGVSKNMLDGRMTLVWANDYFYKLHGYTKDEYFEALKGNTAEMFVHPDDRGAVHAAIEEALTHNRGTIEQTFRIFCKNGSIRWIMMRGVISDEVINGFPVLYMVCTDVTETKQLEQALDTERERYRIALASSSDIIFEYDVISDTFTAYGWFSGSDGARSSSKNVFRDFRQQLRHARFTHADDIEAVEELLSGMTDKEIEVRLVPKLYMRDDINRKYIWTVMSATAMYEERRVYKIIGKIRNNNSDKLNELKLLEESYKDRLTGFYNRGYGLKLLERFMAHADRSPGAVLMAIDIDNLSSINAQYGYMFGDTVISSVSQILGGIMSPDDIAVRLGGDEFLVLLKNTTCAQGYEIGSLICDQAKFIYTGEENKNRVSCSIGMASTEGGAGCRLVLARALSTMMRVKKYDSGCASCYMELADGKADSVEASYFDTYMSSIVTDVYTSGDEDVISFAFGILERTKDLRSAIHVLLLRIGKEFSLCDVRIIRADMEKCVSETEYQWSNSDNFVISAQHDFFEQSGYGLWQKRFEDGDMPFVLPKGEIVDANLGIRSQLLCLCNTEDNVRGVIVFSCQNARMWTDEDKHILKEIGRIIFTHINRAEAITANRAKTDFLSRMSHEIRTPMNAIMVMVTIAKKTVGDDCKTVDCLNKIEHSAGYLLTLVNDVLDMSKIESGKMQLFNDSFDFDSFITDLWLLHSPIAETKGIHLEFNRSYPQCRLYGDSLHLNQVLVNIIGNALKFTPEGGRVTFDVHMLDSADGKATMGFAVTDNGIGIARDNLERIFNAFEQADNNNIKQFGGTGLGLAISNNLVAMMGGRIDVESAVGEGSRFSFTLEFDRPDGSEDKQGSEIAALPAKREESFDFSGLNILLVEDNELNIEIAQSILEMANFNVTVAQNGKEAIETFVCSAEGHFDAVLMDIRMPVMDGITATRNIRKLQRRDASAVPIIAMTANAFDEDMRISRECGMNEHLSKPINANVMFRTLAKYCKSRQNT